MEHGLADGHYGKGAIRFDSIYGAFLTIEQGYEICITVFVRPTLLLTAAKYVNTLVLFFFCCAFF
jgi:hypothetical protein